MNRRNFLKLLGKGTTLLAAVPFVEILKPESEHFGMVATGDEIYISGELPYCKGRIAIFRGTAWEQIS